MSKSGIKLSISDELTDERIRRNNVLVKWLCMFEVGQHVLSDGVITSIPEGIKQKGTVGIDLICHESVHIIGGAVFIGHDVLVFAFLNTVEHHESIMERTFPEQQVTHETAHQSDLGRMQHSPVKLDTCAHTDIDFGSLFIRKMNDIRIQAVNAFKYDKLTGLAAKR